MADETTTEVEADAAPEVKMPAENQIVFVAKAMDIEDKINWDSTDHDQVVARENAKAVAKQMILGVAAVAKMPAAETEEASAEKAKAAADAEAAKAKTVN